MKATLTLLTGCLVVLSAFGQAIPADYEQAMKTLLGHGTGGQAGLGVQGRAR